VFWVSRRSGKRNGTCSLIKYRTSRGHHWQNPGEAKRATEHILRPTIQPQRPVVFGCDTEYIPKQGQWLVHQNIVRPYAPFKSARGYPQVSLDQEIPYRTAIHNSHVFIPIAGVLRMMSSVCGHYAILGSNPRWELDSPYPSQLIPHIETIIMDAVTFKGKWETGEVYFWRTTNRS
jgi:hypothetical protein